METTGDLSEREVEAETLTRDRGGSGGWNPGRIRSAWLGKQGEGEGVAERQSERPPLRRCHGGLSDRN